MQKSDGVGGAGDEASIASTMRRSPSSSQEPTATVGATASAAVYT